MSNSKLNNPILAFVLLIFFLSTHISWAQVSMMPESEVFSKNSPEISIPQVIDIPQSMGSVQSEHRSKTSAPFVFVIQDAHSILDAQTHIQELLGYLENHYGVDRVGLEGGKGPLDALLFQTFPEDPIKKK